MKKKLWTNFLKAFAGTILWITFLLNFFGKDQKVPVTYLWNIFFCAVILCLVFGVIYPFLWEYSTFKAATNIIFSTVANTNAMVLSLLLCAENLFPIFQNYLLYYFLITLMGHVIGFYFYSRYQNRKLAEELNHYLK